MISGPRRLRGGALLVWGEEARPFGPGAYVLGRGLDCAVVLDDPLVSRRHARLIVTPVEVVIEDLMSANGVFINGVRLERARALCDGDRVLLATREISVFEAAQAELEAARPPLASDPFDADRASVLPTERPDPFAVVGPMAERLLGAGRIVEAERLLGDQMHRLLAASRVSLVTPEVCQTATLYAMKLARTSYDGKWVNFGVELCLRIRQLMPELVIDELKEALMVVPEVDADLYRDYLDVLRGMSPSMTRAELELVNRLACLKIPGA